EKKRELSQKSPRLATEPLKHGAGNEARTRDSNLGKVVLYH
ncbi:hypothetical protein BMETH_1341125709, partial [methanotrophic bacterial endosymbiont of Bathymodiolus sp.]